MAPIAIVTGCRLCPLEATVSVGYDDVQSICQHPDAKDEHGSARDVAPENNPAPETPPDWCPLRQSALVVKLTLPAKPSKRRKPPEVPHV